MSDPLIGEIRMFAGSFEPRGWARCDGRLLSISRHSALFSVVGTAYGGDGMTNFALPDLRGRAPIHVGPGLDRGQGGGEEFHTLVADEMPPHNHQVNATETAADTNRPVDNFPAQTNPFNLYAASTANLTRLHPNTIMTAGNNRPHNNLQPFLVLNFIIALVGKFPSPDGALS